MLLLSCMYIDHSWKSSSWFKRHLLFTLSSSIFPLMQSEKGCKICFFRNCRTSKLKKKVKNVEVAALLFTQLLFRSMVVTGIMIWLTNLFLIWNRPSAWASEKEAHPKRWSRQMISSYYVTKMGKGYLVSPVTETFIVSLQLIEKMQRWVILLYLW